MYLRHRFVCRAVLGGKQGHGARWLSPVPPEAFVYGSGESTVVLTKVSNGSTWMSEGGGEQSARRQMACLNNLSGGGEDQQGHQWHAPERASAFVNRRQARTIALKGGPQGGESGMAPLPVAQIL